MGFSVLAVVLAAWLGLNVIAAAVTWAWHRVWARGVMWDEDGLMPSARPYSVGEGKAAFLLVHGFNDVPFVWKRMADRIAAAGFACRAIRLPGAGERFGRASLDRMRQAIRDEVQALRERHKTVILVGHSMGGALSLDFLLDGGEGIAGLVLLAPLIEISRVRSPLLSPRAYYRLLRACLPFLHWVPSIFREYLTAEDDSSFSYRRDRFVEVGWYPILFKLVDRLRVADKCRLCVPILAYAAGNDRVVDTDATCRWFADMPCELQVVEGAAHPLQLGKGWELMADRMVQLGKRNML